jgi:hypothetical protein
LEPRYRTGPAFITARAEMGSATSRNPPGHRYIVRLCGPGESVIVAGGLSETGANRVAEAINEFLGHVFGRPTSDQFFWEIKD